MSDAVKLSIKFLTEIKSFPKNDKGVVQAPDQYKDIVWKSFEKLLTQGYTGEAMIEAMDTYKTSHPTPTEAYSMEEIVKFLELAPQSKAVKKKHNPDNLLEAGRFYYHPALQIAPPPPLIEVNPDGTFKASYEEDEFFLEIKDEFTLDDLIAYYHKRIPSGKKRRNLESDRGSFKFLLKSYDLDVILYCIDESAISEYLPATVFDIEDHAETAELILEDRKNTLFEVGLDHVIPR